MSLFLGLLLKGEAVDVEMTAQLLYLPRRREGGRERGRDGDREGGDG